MEQFLEVYGKLPEVVGKVDLDTSDAEMCFVQYLPVRIPLQKLYCCLPTHLEVYRAIVDQAILEESVNCNNHPYIYLTVKRLYGACGRDGWHSDGFGTDDVNYIWYDSHPTVFLSGCELKLPHDHSESMEFMERNISDADDQVMYPCNTLIKMNQSNIHRVNPVGYIGLRTFVKVSFSDSKYNLKGNAHYYGLNYNWEMVDRNVGRNHPIKEN